MSENWPMCSANRSWTLNWPSCSGREMRVLEQSEKRAEPLQSGLERQMSEKVAAEIEEEVDLTAILQDPWTDVKRKGEDEDEDVLATDSKDAVCHRAVFKPLENVMQRRQCK
eukprot:gb/GFBE01046524.1/.p1 GENE.gb/GFBE01046524.1/~~gb/GFBE01046524.1/.p1  ORF type:complete len:112 (+),score=27.06 gb/GFBE01046524.1/:1-336(+)